MEIERYSCKYKDTDRDCMYIAEHNGDYVLYSDHMKDLAQERERAEKLYDAIGLKGEDRCFDGIIGAHILNRNAIRLQKERADKAEAENAKLQDIQRENKELKERLAAATEILEHVRLQFPLKDYGLDVLEDVEEFLTALKPKC